jgi:hypothetical protein
VVADGETFCAVGVIVGAGVKRRCGLAVAEGEAVVAGPVWDLSPIVGADDGEAVGDTLGGNGLLIVGSGLIL